MKRKTAIKIIVALVIAGIIMATWGVETLLWILFGILVFFFLVYILFDYLTKF